MPDPVLTDPLGGLGGALKLPPHSIEAEQSVLGGLMLDNSAWDQIADRVSEDDFYRRDHRLVFRAIQQLAEKGGPVDVVTLSEWLEQQKLLDEVGGLAYLGALAKNTPTAANIRAYADIVRERSVLRQLIRVGTEIANSGFEPEGRDSKALLDEAEKKVFEIAEQVLRNRAGFRSIKELLVKAVDRIDALFQQDNAITGVATGFGDLDERTAGLQPSDLIIIAGRPSMGKTSLAMNLAEHAAIKHQVPVAVFSMEMPGEQLAMRLLSSLGRIDQHRVRTGKLDDDDWPRLTSAVSLLADAPMYVDDTPALTPGELRARCRRLKRERGLGLIVIDYLQLMQVAGTKENRATEISEISRGLKALAKEMNVPVIALSQLNRSLEQRPDKRPRMADLRECVTGDTRVLLSDGRRIPIRDLVGQQPEVWALSEQGGLVACRSDRVWPVGVREVFTVKLASGRSLIATGQHRLYGATGWAQVKDLVPGHRLAVARRIPEPAEICSWPDHQVVLLAHLVGDGSYLSGQPLRYTTASEANSAAVEEAACAFGARVTRHPGPRGSWHQLVISGNGDRWHPRGVGKWLKGLGIFGQRSHDKRLPGEVFRFGDAQIALLLRHLWATDGCIAVRREGDHGAHRVFFSTASGGLAQDVAALLLRLGMVARLHSIRQRQYRPVYCVDVSGAEQQRRFLDRVGAFGPRAAAAVCLADRLHGMKSNPNVDTLPHEVMAVVRGEMSARGVTTRAMAALRGTTYGGSAHFRFAPSHRLVREYAELLDSERLRAAADDTLFWDRVVAIEPGGEQEVYDISVPGPESWLADGIVSHNSGAIEQDADVIIFIYRDEVYNPESQEKGKAEIIIAKQRNGPTGMLPLTFLGQFTRFESYAEDDLPKALGFDKPSSPLLPRKG